MRRASVDISAEVARDLRVRAVGPLPSQGVRSWLSHESHRIQGAHASRVLPLGKPPRVAPPLDSTGVHWHLWIMSDKSRQIPRKPAGRGKAKSKLRPKWQFAVDAVGMVKGPRDLSARKGLSA